MTEKIHSADSNPFHWRSDPNGGLRRRATHQGHYQNLSLRLGIADIEYVRPRYRYFRRLCYESIHGRLLKCRLKYSKKSLFHELSRFPPSFPMPARSTLNTPLSHQ